MFFISWKIQYDKNEHSYGQPVTGSFITTTCPLMYHISYRVFFAKHQITQVTQLPYSPDLVPWKSGALLASPKTKITLEREEISDCWWDSGKYNGAADGDSNKEFCRVFCTVEGMQGGTVWGRKVPTLKETEKSLSYVQYFLYLLQLMSLFFIVHGWILSGQSLSGYLTHDRN